MSWLAISSWIMNGWALTVADFDLLLFHATHSISLSAVPGSVWFCVKIGNRIGIAKTKAKIFHCGLLNKDNSIWLSSVDIFLGALLRFDYMDFSNTLQTPPVFLTWSSSPQPCSKFISLLDIFNSTVLLSSVHHSMFILFSSWGK